MLGYVAEPLISGIKMELQSLWTALASKWSQCTPETLGISVAVLMTAICNIEIKYSFRTTSSHV